MNRIVHLRFNSAASPWPTPPSPGAWYLILSPPCPQQAQHNRLICSHSSRPARNLIAPGSATRRDAGRRPRVSARHPATTWANWLECELTWSPNDIKVRRSAAAGLSRLPTHRHTGCSCPLTGVVKRERRLTSRVPLLFRSTRVMTRTRSMPTSLAGIRARSPICGRGAPLLQLSRPPTHRV